MSSSFDPPSSPFPSEGVPPADGFSSGGDGPSSLLDQLWSPVQNTALWCAWWLHDVIHTDEVLDAFRLIQGSHHMVELADSARGRVEVGVDMGLLSLLRLARSVTNGWDARVDGEPLVGLLLAGAGELPRIGAGSVAARDVMEVGSALMFPDAASAAVTGTPSVVHVVVPHFVGEVIRWTWHVVDGPVRPLAVFSPGEADAMLREAVEHSATLIQAVKVEGGVGSLEALRGVEDPALAVGMLSDVFGLPGLPPGVAVRAEQLMARADYVAAIVQVVRESAVGALLDAQLLPMLRAIRLARMVAVDVAQRELLRS